MTDRTMLETQLGKPREEWQAEDLVGFARGRDIRIVSLMHIGGDGFLKTLDFVPRSDVHLLNVLHGGERADGSSLFAGLGIPTDASDIVLRPRLSSAFLDPFAERPTLVLLCGHAGRDGEPLTVSPDTIVRRAYARLAKETGLRLWALGEVEFFLGKRATESDMYGADERGYHASSPFVFGEALRRRALVCLADMGIPCKYGHSEVGYIGASEPGGVIWEQHEIELDLMPLPQAAEAVALTAWVLRNLAHRAGMQLSLDPVMSERHAGNGLHVHLSPRRGGVHVGGRDADGRLSEPTRRLVGGLVTLGGALMAFGNRAPGSFVRLRRGHETPKGFVWGEFDRSALVRIPFVARTTEGRAVAPPTVEFRLPDGSAHTHLVLAGVAQAVAATDPDGEIAEAGAVVEPVPGSFVEVGEALARHRATLEAGEVFPAAMLDTLIEKLDRDEPPV